MTLNELVKLTTLWTTGPRCLLDSSSHDQKPKCNRRTDNMKTVYLPTKGVCRYNNYNTNIWRLPISKIRKNYFRMSSADIREISNTGTVILIVSTMINPTKPIKTKLALYLFMRTKLEKHKIFWSRSLSEIQNKVHKKYFEVGLFRKYKTNKQNILKMDFFGSTEQMKDRNKQTWFDSVCSQEIIKQEGHDGPVTLTWAT